MLTLFSLTAAWLDHDNLKQRIRNGEYVGLIANNSEPVKLLRVQYTNINRQAVGIPSIFD